MSTLWNNYLVKSTWGKVERKKTSKISAFALDDIMQNHPSISHYCKIFNYHPSKIDISLDKDFNKEFKVYLSKFGNGAFNIA